MDALVGFLEGPRAREAFLLRSIMDPPWSIRIQDEAPLTIVAMVRGDAWIAFDGGDPTHLGVGDVAIVRGPEPYTVADAISTAATDRDPSRPALHHTGWREHGRGDGSRRAHVGQLRERLDHDAHRHLPGRRRDQPATSRRASVTCCVARRRVGHTPHRFADERDRERRTRTAGRARSVARPVVDRRVAHVVRVDPTPTRRLGITQTPIPSSARALRMLHNNPAEPWTVASLAAAVGVSRASLARRFHELVDEPPMTFLARWRLALAADLLLEPGATVGSVARQVGYGSPFTFSTAFKRQYGISPKAHRSATAPCGTAAS